MMELTKAIVFESSEAYRWWCVNIGCWARASVVFLPNPATTPRSGVWPISEQPEATPSCDPVSSELLLFVSQYLLSCCECVAAISDTVFSCCWCVAVVSEPVFGVLLYNKMRNWSTQCTATYFWPIRCKHWVHTSRAVYVLRLLETFFVNVSIIIFLCVSCLAQH